MKLEKKSLFYITLFLCLFTVIGFGYSGYKFIENFRLNGDYFILLFSTIVNLIIFILSFSIFSNLFINSTKNIENKNYLGSIKHISHYKAFPYVITELTIQIEEEKFEKIELKSFIIDLYKDEFNVGQKVFANKDKTLISLQPIVKEEVLNIKSLFKNKSFLTTVLFKAKAI